MNVLLIPKKAWSSARFPLSSRRAFTLVELLVSIAILAIMVGLIATIGTQTNNVWTQSSRRIEQFQSARNAFEVMTRTIAQATLNTYYQALPVGGPYTTYGRASDLEFVSGTVNATGMSTMTTSWATTTVSGTPPVPTAGPPGQISHAIFFALPQGYTATTASTALVANTATGSTTITENGNSTSSGGVVTTAGTTSCIGLDNLLCACGFYIQYSKGLFTPGFLPSTNASETAYRFRLMEVLPPTENFPIYSCNSSSASPNSWIKGMWPTTALPSAWPTATTSGWVHQVASNIIALIISPEDPSASPPTSIAPKYDYDSWPDSSVASQQALTKYQLPPVIHITMVAIDEKSAIELGNPATPVDFGQNVAGNTSPSSTYTTAPFTVAANLASDLAKLQQNLTNRHINSRVFDMRIPLRGSKWSSQ